MGRCGSGSGCINENSSSSSSLGASSSSPAWSSASLREEEDSRCFLVGREGRSLSSEDIGERGGFST